jgi:hypothetical protein
MIEIICRLLNNIDSVKAFLISISSAFFGSILSVDTNTLAAQVQDPVWFCMVKPYFQIGAWSVAIVAGVLGVISSIRKLKRK